MRFPEFVKATFAGYEKAEYVYRDACTHFDEAKALPLPFKFGSVNAVSFALACVSLWSKDLPEYQPKERVSFRGTMTPDSGWFCADGIGGESDRCAL